MIRKRRLPLPPGAKLVQTLEFHGYWYERDRSLREIDNSSA